MTRSTTTTFARPAANRRVKYLDRAWAALDEIFAADHSMPLVVTHGNLIALVLQSLDHTFGYEGWKSLSNPDVFMVRGTGSGPMTFERIWRPLHPPSSTMTKGIIERIQATRFTPVEAHPIYFRTTPEQCIQSVASVEVTPKPATKPDLLIKDNLIDLSLNCRP